MHDINFIIVSGMSGSGKTIALQALEDLGYYCIDNLPAVLLPTLAKQMLGERSQIKNCAISIDSRNRDFIYDIIENFSELSSLNIDYKIIFLDTDSDTLIKRFSETRRKHPLSSKQTSLVEAIDSERKILEPLSENADRHINTSTTTPHELRAIVRDIAATSSSQSLTLLFESFGFKYGNPNDADFVFDVRCLPNPHWEKELRPFTGLDKSVQSFLIQHKEVNSMIKDIKQFVEKWLPQFKAENRSYITVAIGCTGGKHRSVFISSQLQEYFSNDKSLFTQIRHRELRH